MRIMLAIFVLTLVMTEQAQAYVGPGAGLSVLGALWALLAVIFSALGYIIFWPVRRLMKQRGRNSKQQSEHASGAQQQGQKRSASQPASPSRGLNDERSGSRQ